MSMNVKQIEAGSHREKIVPSKQHRTGINTLKVAEENWRPAKKEKFSVVDA